MPTPVPARIAAAAVPLLAVVAVPALVAARLGPDGGGVFAAAWSFAVVVGAATTAVVWRSLRAPGPVPDDDRRRARERALLLAVPVVVVLLVGSPWLLAVFGRHARDTGIGSLVLLALATVPYAAVAVTARAAAVAGRVRAAVVPSGTALVAALACGWVLMPVVGVLGAAFAWLLAWSAVAAVLLVRSRSMITRPGAAAGVTGERAPRWTR